MISRSILAKGQIVIPKVIRDLLGMNVGDEVLIDVENDRIIISKKQDVLDVFSEVCSGCMGNVSMKDIKKELEARYKET